MIKLVETAPSNARDVAQLWGAYCRRLEAIGRDVIERYAAESAEQAAEAIIHLTRLARTSLEWQVESSDSKHPRLMWYDRSCAAAAPYAPNIDNSYLLVRVDAAESYRLALDVDAIDEINISAHTGSPYDGNMAVYGDLNLCDLDIDGSRGQILFSRARREGAWFELPKGVEYLFIRFYYWNWDRTQPPAIEFERLGDDAVRPPYTPPRELLQRLTAAAHWLEGVMRFGHRFGEHFLEGGTANVPGPLRGVAGGGGKIRYGGLRFDLQREEALIIEFEPPQARYWSIQWQKLPWGDPIDSMHHLMSFNQTQARIDDDGRVRVVISHEDPAIQNWLDTGGRRCGLVMYRWIWSTSEPLPTARVAKMSELAVALPAGTPRFDAADRAAQLERRRRHLSRRY